MRLTQIPRISQFLHAWWKISRRLYGLWVFEAHTDPTDLTVFARLVENLTETLRFVGFGAHTDSTDLTVLHAWWEISRRIRVICVALNPYISLFSSFFTKKFIGIDSIIHVCNQTILLRCKTSTASSYSKKNTINALIDDAKIHENFQNLKSFRSFYHCFSLFNHHSHDAHVSLPNFDFHKKPMCNTSARHMPLI